MAFPGILSARDQLARRLGAQGVQMDNSDRAWDLLLREYAEAGQVSRQHEVLTRTSATVFVPMLITLSGYVFSSAAPQIAKAALALVGLVASVLAANVVRRHQVYYRSYIKRAKAIESELKVGEKQVLQLYTIAESAPTGSCTISNKTAFVVFFLSSAFVFGVSSIAFICARFCGHAP